jgi:hypothetical protein
VPAARQWRGLRCLYMGTLGELSLSLGTTLPSLAHMHPPAAGGCMHICMSIAHMHPPALLMKTQRAIWVNLNPNVFKKLDRRESCMH